jgi:hypothetical protein
MPSRGNQKDQVLPNREVPYRGVHTAESEPDSTAKQRNRSGSEVSDSTVESEVESRQSPRNLHVPELSAFSASRRRVDSTCFALFRLVVCSDSAQIRRCGRP